jgi:hypothetical protein
MYPKDWPRCPKCDDWDAVDRMIGRHFRDRTWRQPKTPAGTYTI